jgi:hypothetical protein
MISESWTEWLSRKPLVWMVARQSLRAGISRTQGGLLGRSRTIHGQ